MSDERSARTAEALPRTRSSALAERSLRFAPFIVWFVASALRLLCTRFDFPNPTHPDEWTIVSAATRTIRGGDLNPHFFNYPSLLIYIEAALLKVFATLGLSAPLMTLDGPVNAPNWYEAIHLGRVAVALMGGATAAASCYAGTVFADRTTGVLAGLFVTFSVLLLSFSHTLTVDGPTAFFVALALAASLRLTQPKRTLAHYVLGGIAVGLAAGTKYTGGAVLLPFVTAHFVGAFQKDERFVEWRFVLGLLAAGVAFAASTPYAILEWESVYEALKVESFHYRTGHPGFEAEGRRSYLEYARHLFELGGPFLTIAAVLGVPIAIADKRLRGPALVLVPFVLVYLGIIGNYRVHFARNLTPVIPFLAVLAAAGIASVMRRAVRRPIVGVLLGLALSCLFGQEAFRGTEYVRVMRLPDTRTVAQRWIHERLPAGSLIVVELYNPPVSSERFHARFTNLNGLIRFPGATLDADYMITVSDEYARYLDAPHLHPDEARLYRALFAEHPEVRRFEEDRSTLRGPTIRILRRPRPDERVKPAQKPDDATAHAPITPGAEGPAVHPGAATVADGLTRDQVRTAMAEHHGAFLVCYMNGLASDRNLQGQLTLRFSVRPDGTVADSTLEASTLGAPIIEQCMVRTLSGAVFPRPTNGGTVEVRHPFVFTN